jgi:hypothetical protein
MHGLYYQATETVGPDDVNHFERADVLPIAFSLFHYTNMEVTSFMALTGEPPTWNDKWRDRVQMTVNDNGKERTVAEMVEQRIGDYDAFREYMQDVFDRSEIHLARIDPADLPTSLFRGPSQRRWPAPTAPAALDPRASRCWTVTNAGCTSTGCGTWGRSSTPEALLAWVA